MANKQKISMTTIDGFWDYEGEYRNEKIKVRKIDTHEWEGTIEGICGTDKTAEKKKEAVNILVEEVDDILEEEKGYQETMYEGNPVFSVNLVKEENYEYSERKQVTSEEDIEEFLNPYFEGLDREKIVLLLMDAGNTIIGLHELSVGGLTSSSLDVRNVMKVAILANAPAIALAHNHPSGNPEPSRTDIKITRQIAEAGDMMDITLHDHIIFGDGTTSLRARNVL